MRSLRARNLFLKREGCGSDIGVCVREGEPEEDERQRVERERERVEKRRMEKLGVEKWTITLLTTKQKQERARFMGGKKGEKKREG